MALNQELIPHISQLDTIENEEAKPFFWSLIDPDGPEDWGETFEWFIQALMVEYNTSS
jgi:hypothetical protein